MKFTKELYAEGSNVFLLIRIVYSCNPSIIHIIYSNIQVSDTKIT